MKKSAYSGVCLMPMNMNLFYTCDETGLNAESCSCDYCVFVIQKYNNDYKNRVKWNYLCYHEIQPQMLDNKESNLDFCVKCDFGLGSVEGVTRKLVEQWMVS